MATPLKPAAPALPVLQFSTLAGDEYQKRSILVAGRAGIGKTSLLRSFGPRLRQLPDGTPDWSRALYIAGDPGHASISDLKAVRTFRPFVNGKLNDLLLALNAGQSKDFDLIMVDGVDKISTEVLNQFAEAEAKKPKPDTRGMWGEFGTAMQKWMMGMRDLPGANIVFTTHVRVDEDGEFRFRPQWAGGKVGGELSGMFDFCFHMKWAKLKPEGKPERAFITNQNGDYNMYDVKARVPVTRPPLPQIFPADLDLLWKHLFD